MKEQVSHKDIVIKPQEGFQMQFASSCVDVNFGGAGLGTGKALLLNELVCTPNGFKKVQEVKVGDKITNPCSGKTEAVIVVHPIERHPYYRITFNDGTHCDCSSGHLWTVKRNGYQNRPWRILSAEDLFVSYNSTKKRFSIPFTEPVIFRSNQRLPIPSYVMGALLGNGCMSDSSIKNYMVSLTSRDSEIEKGFVKRWFDMSHKKRQPGCYNYNIYGKDIIDKIKSLGLSYHKAHNKFVPDMYKYASIQNRKELIQGLIDTDGYVDKDGSMYYYSISKRLAEDVAFIVRSLGMWASINSKPCTIANKGGKGRKFTGNTLYTVTISGYGDSMKDLVTVKRKRDRLKDNKSYTHKTIKSVDYLGIREGRCITVDNPSGLFITNNFIVTHNSFALVLALAEPLMTDPDFRAVITRRSLQSQKSGGGFVDTFKSIFGDYCSVKTADSPRITFPSGAYCDLTYIDDTNLDKMREQWKGKQIDAICIDEITEMSWEAFSYVQTRNRGRSKTFTGKFFATLNPKRSHWTRKFLDWYIGVDGFIMPDRNGKVRYFYVNGSTVDDVVWGDSKEEVYAKCKIDIDRKLARIGGNFTYHNMIKSFVFYQGHLSENRAMTDNNPNYIGSVAASGGKMAQALFEGNFNVDPEEDEKIPIPSNSAQGVFNNNPAVNGDKWITVDLADYGTDNLVALAWDGFHAYDILILSKSTPRENAMAVKTFAFEHGTAESHIIFDATAGRYFNDYIPDAVPYISLNKPFGLYQLTAMTVKDMCYIRLCKMIEAGNFTFDDKLAVQTYTHQNLKYKVTVENEFMEECSVVRFDDMQSGKKRLWNKKKMNQMLGKGRSMDLLDPCAMRMLPCAMIEYGSEIQAGYYNHEEEARQASNTRIDGSIYDDTTWY